MQEKPRFMYSGTTPHIHVRNDDMDVGLVITPAQLRLYLVLIYRLGKVSGNLVDL